MLEMTPRPTSRLRSAALALCLAVSSGSAAAITKTETTILTQADAPMVSKEAAESPNHKDVLASNAEVVNALFSEHLRIDEISAVAAKSYYVDYYLAQMNNGGFAQFVFNTQWNPAIVALVRQGLTDLGAARHRALFDEGAASVAALAEKDLAAYLRDDEVGGDSAFERLGAINEKFFALAKTEDLIALNAAWLRARPGLRALGQEELRAEIARRAAAAPDRSERIRAAEAASPRYLRLIRALCEKAGQTLQRVTAGDPTIAYDGRTVRRLGAEELEAEPVSGAPVTWFFITDKGLHLMAEANGKAAMFDDVTKTKLAEIDAQAEP